MQPPTSPTPFQKQVIEAMKKSGEVNHLKAKYYNNVVEHAAKSNKLKPVFGFPEVVDLKNFAIANSIVRTYLKERKDELPLTESTYSKESSKQFKISATGSAIDLKFSRKGHTIRDLLNFYHEVNKEQNPIPIPQHLTPRSPKSPKSPSRAATVSKINPNIGFSDGDDDEWTERSIASRGGLKSLNGINQVKMDSDKTESDF